MKGSYAFLFILPLVGCAMRVETHEPSNDTAIQVIPAITNTFGIPLMLLPLFFVVFVDAVFMVRLPKRSSLPVLVRFLQEYHHVFHSAGDRKHCVFEANFSAYRTFAS